MIPNTKKFKRITRKFLTWSDISQLEFSRSLNGEITKIVLYDNNEIFVIKQLTDHTSILCDGERIKIKKVNLNHFVKWLVKNYL